MPITKCNASKATPAKGIAYIMDPEKVIARGSQGFVTSDPKQMAHQMLQTMHLYGKGFDYDERKYYHTKVAFDPKDRPENGGKLVPAMANDWAAKYAAKTWPGREVVWAVQDHGASIHIHFIVAACERDTGKKLDVRDAEYREWKDRAQEMAEEYGLSTLDWRKATKEKRTRENQGEYPDNPTFAEQGLRSRGQSVWKDELRDIIDLAAITCSSMDEFRAFLESQGVTLTRCTEQTISYKLGDHKACRGDTLGADYTAEAIRDTLAHNREPEPIQSGRVDDMISGAAKQAAGIKPVTLKERQVIREMGRLAGMPRAEVDAMCDHAPKATWEEKQFAWNNSRTHKDNFWLEWNIQNQALQKQISQAYAKRKFARECEWLLDPRNRRSSFIGVVFAMIYLSTHRDVDQWNDQIATLKRQQQELRKAGNAFKVKSSNATAVLREKGLTKEAYLKGVEELQIWADAIRMQNEHMLTPEEIEKQRKIAIKKREEQAKAWKPKEGKPQPKKSRGIDR